VTSCAVDQEGYLLGQAHIKLKHTLEGTPIAVFQGAAEGTGMSTKNLMVGERVSIPTPATVLSRFPEREG
jgi:hypothetical protein